MLKYIIFDLDDTLYPRDTGLMHEVGRRIQIWLCDYLGLTWEEAIVRRREYFHRYGTTLGGLMAEHDDISVRDYLAFVHDIPVGEYLEPNPALAAMLDVIPLRKAIYTNATSSYGRRVLQALGVPDRFERVIGIEEVGLHNKFQCEAYEQALALLNAQGHECIMVEDSVGNLQPAKELGLTTVWVHEDGSTPGPGVGRDSRVQASVHDEIAAVPEEYVDFVVENVLEVGHIVRRLLCSEV
jgi:putative hydrolase of the HAD superfamily